MMIVPNRAIMPMAIIIRATVNVPKVKVRRSRNARSRDCSTNWRAAKPMRPAMPTPMASMGSQNGTVESPMSDNP